MKIVFKWVVSAVLAGGVIVLAVTFFNQLTKQEFDNFNFEKHPSIVDIDGTYRDTKVMVLDEGMTIPLLGYGKNIVDDWMVQEAPKYPIMKPTKLKFGAVNFNFKTIDGSFVTPCSRRVPIMPKNATKSGHCNMKFSISVEGRVTHIKVINCSDIIFKAPSVSSLSKWQYPVLSNDGGVAPRENERIKITYILIDEQGQKIPE